jgi:uncharacterized protein
MLHIAPNFNLPTDAVTETFAILAKRRAGKSNAAVVMAEEMYDNGLPWVAIDPKGDWWGVRASGDGKAPGLSVLVFGGLHGDVPLEPTSGNLVADLVVGQRLTCVLDVSEMTKADQRRFLTDFATRLYRTNREPLHVFCEEADEYIPQRVVGDVAKLVGAFETLVKRGGFRGIGVTLITQRSASLNKDVLTQIETLIPMRTPSPQDRKAILAWVDVHASGTEAVNELPTLEDGEAWVFSPQWLKTLTKIKFRRRRTFDSGSTPKVGGKPRPPATLAEVDLDSIKTAMAETIEKAEANDPKALKRRILELQSDLLNAQRDNDDLRRSLDQQTPTVVEVPVLTEEHLAALDQAIADIQQVVNSPRPDPVSKVVQQSPQPALTHQPHFTIKKDPQPAPEPVRTPSSPPVVSRAGQNLPKAQKAILTVLYHGPRDKQRLAVLTGYSAGGGGFNNPLSRLRVEGLIEGKGTISITDAGRAAIGPVDPLPHGTELREYWKAHPAIGKAGRLILDALAEHGPMDKESLAAVTGYSSGGGGFNNPLSRLRSLGLVHGYGEEIRIDDDLLD